MDDGVMLLFGAGLWLILAVVVNSYAKTKGRDDGTWFLISLVLSPLIAFIILAVLPPAVSETGDASLYRKCPQCAEVVRTEAKICRYCRSDLPPLEPPVAIPEELAAILKEEQRSPKSSISLAGGLAIVAILAVIFLLVLYGAFSDNPPVATTAERTADISAVKPTAPSKAVAKKAARQSTPLSIESAPAPAALPDSFHSENVIPAVPPLPEARPITPSDKFALKRPDSMTFIPKIPGASYHQAESAILDFNGQLGHYDIVTVGGMSPEEFREKLIPELERNAWHATLTNCWQTLQFKNIEDLCIESNPVLAAVLKIVPTDKNRDRN